jgi:TonB family protein
MPRSRKKQDAVASELLGLDAWLPKVTRPKLWRMGRFLYLVCALLTLIALSDAVAESPAQTGTGPDAPQGEVILTKLSQPVYPPLALQARIVGDVELSLSVRQDGSVGSVQVVSGHPLLQRAALDSAHNSQFECRACGGPLTSYRLVYTFQLGPTVYCAPRDGSYPQVTQSQSHVTLLDEPVGTCDTAAEIRKVRSAKCLYLWKCGRS